MRKSEERRARLKPPKHLSSQAQVHWKALAEEDFGIDDHAGQLLLTTAMKAFDAMRQAQKIMVEEGAVIPDRFDQPKAHPATMTARDSRSQMLIALKALNLDIEPLKEAVNISGRV